MLLSLLLHWIVTAAVLLLVANMIPGITVQGFSAAMWAALIMGLINVLIRPVLSIMTLPINILTLGLFGLIVNALLFGLAAWVVPGFEVYSFWSAFFGAILLTVVIALIDMVLPHTPRNA